MTRSVKLLAVAVFLVFSICLLPLSDAATGVVDQKQEENGWGAGIKGHYPMGQEFVPSLNTLHGVELRISEENPGGDTLTVNIRSGSIGGPVLVTASTWASGTSGWVSFAWSPVRVTVGATYVIELIAATPGILEWDVKDSGNPYPAGRLILLGVPQADQDATFRTYGSSSAVQPVGGFVEPVKKLAVFSPYLVLFGFVATVTIVLWKRPDNQEQV